MKYTITNATHTEIEKNWTREKGEREREMTGRHCYEDVIPFTVMVAIECSNVGVNVLFKAATEKGLSYYVFIAYSFAVSTLVLLLPLPFFIRWCCPVSSHIQIHSFFSVNPFFFLPFSLFIWLVVHLWRSRGLPPLKVSLMFRIFLLGVIG